MSLDINNLKKRILYRSSHRGTKEMDILMTNFVNSLINKLSLDYLKTLDMFINMDDETLISLKKKESNIKQRNKKMLKIIDIFQNFK